MYVEYNNTSISSNPTTHTASEYNTPVDENIINFIPLSMIIIARVSVVTYANVPEHTHTNYPECLAPLVASSSCFGTRKSKTSLGQLS